MDKNTVLSKLCQLLAIYQMLEITDDILFLLDDTATKLEINMLNDIALKLRQAHQNTQVSNPNENE
jgi:hypothetical protein